METVNKIVSEKAYQVCNGTFYHAETSKEVIMTLEKCRLNRTRIVVDYGDTKTGKSWGETCDVTGTIGRSTGTVKIPLLIHNVRSTGGGGILDHCIIGIKESKGKLPLFTLNIKK